MLLRSNSLKIYGFLILLISANYCRAGNTQTGSRALLSFEKDNLTFFYHPEDRETALRVLNISETAFPRLEQLLGLKQSRKIIIFIASDENEFRRLTGGQIPDWGAAAAIPEQGIIALKSQRIDRDGVDLEKTAVHEMCHVLLSQATGNRVVPRWFDEGFARWASSDFRFLDYWRLLRAFSIGQHIPLEDLDDVLLFQRDKASLAYSEALTAFSFLMDKGPRVLPGVVQAFSKGASMDEALQSTIATGLDGFEKEWLAEMKRRYSWGFLIEAPVLISIIMLILLFAAWISVRRRVAQRKKEWEEEESYAERYD